MCNSEETLLSNDPSGLHPVIPRSDKGSDLDLYGKQKADLRVCLGRRVELAY